MGFGKMKTVTDRALLAPRPSETSWGRRDLATFQSFQITNLGNEGKMASSLQIPPKLMILLVVTKRPFCYPFLS
jgi:hypothetical protein